MHFDIALSSLGGLIPDSFHDIAAVAMCKAVPVPMAVRGEKASEASTAPLATSLAPAKQKLSPTAGCVSITG